MAAKAEREEQRAAKAAEREEQRAAKAEAEPAKAAKRQRDAELFEAHQTAKAAVAMTRRYEQVTPPRHTPAAKCVDSAESLLGLLPPCWLS
jgi:hypothetical protein